MTESGKRAVISIPNFIKVLIGINYINLNKNIKEVSNLTKLSYSTTTRLISRFETTEKWVVIKRHKINPAKNQVKLTEKGQKILATIEIMLYEMGIDCTKKGFFEKVLNAK